MVINALLATITRDDKASDSNKSNVPDDSNDSADSSLILGEWRFNTI